LTWLGTPSASILRVGGDPKQAERGALLRIGYAYPFEVWPPSGGNKIHALQLVKRFIGAGHEVVTLGDGSLEGLRPAASPQEFLGSTDITYVRVDGYPLEKLGNISALMRESLAPIVVELNAPANENLAFSWLGGSERPEGGLFRALDSLKRAIHAFRVNKEVRREDRFRKELAKRWDAAICVSSAVQAYARTRLGVGRTIVVPNGTDPEEMNPGIPPARLSLPENHLIVLYAGSPKYPWQGLHLLRAVIHRAFDQDLPLTFLLLVHKPSHLIPDLPNVVVLDGVKYSEMAQYINASDVCVSLQPEFHWSEWGFHGSPTKFFDYMACGRPVLASKVGQMKEIVEQRECGVLCEYDVEDVERKLLMLAADRELARRLGENGRRAVEEVYNWDVVARTTLGLFEGLLLDSKGSAGG
jgi:glycosyltransferase involved in cell wall biosynthesis